MNKLFILTFFILITSVSYAQIGINTDTPNPTVDLDVNGNILVRSGMLKLGTDANLGVAGQLLQSQGPNNPPKWVTPESPNRNLKPYYLDQSFVLSDEVGIRLQAADDSGDQLYTENESTAGGWKVIPGLTYSFELEPLDPSNPTVAIENKMLTSLQTIVQMNNNANNQIGAWVTFSIGIFIDDQLKTVRVGEIIANGGFEFLVFNMIGTFYNLTAGKHKLQVAVKRRNSKAPTGASSNPIITIGAPAAEANNLNNFMSKSVLRIDLYLKSLEP